MFGLFVIVLLFVGFCLGIVFGMTNDYLSGMASAAAARREQSKNQ